MRTRSRKLRSIADSIDTAIVLLLTGFYSDAVCRVAADAHKKLSSYERDQAAEDPRLAPLLERADVFLATADLSLDAEVSGEELDHLLFLTTLQLEALDYRLTLNMLIFRIWYLAVYPDEAIDDLESGAQRVLPSLATLSREEQLKHGEVILRRMTDHRGTGHVA